MLGGVTLAEHCEGATKLAC